MTTVSILTITMELVNNPTKQPNCIDIFVVNSLYKINTKSIKLIYVRSYLLDVEQFGISSDYIVHTPNVQKVFLLHAYPRKDIPWIPQNVTEYFLAYNSL